MFILVTVLSLLLHCTDTTFSYSSLFFLVWRHGSSFSRVYRQKTGYLGLNSWERLGFFSSPQLPHCLFEPFILLSKDHYDLFPGGHSGFHLEWMSIIYGPLYWLSRKNCPCTHDEGMYVGQEPLLLLHMRLGGLQSWYGCFEKEPIASLGWDLNPRPSSS